MFILLWTSTSRKIALIKPEICSQINQEMLQQNYD